MANQPRTSSTSKEPERLGAAAKLGVHEERITTVPIVLGIASRFVISVLVEVMGLPVLLYREASSGLWYPIAEYKRIRRIFCTSGE